MVCQFLNEWNTCILISTNVHAIHIIQCTLYITNNYSQIKFENQTSKYQIMSKVKKICQNNLKCSIFFYLTKNKFLTQKIIDILKKAVKSYFFKNNIKIISYLNI